MNINYNNNEDNILMTWMPIETAPLDGTYFLGYRNTKREGQRFFVSHAEKTWKGYRFFPCRSITHWEFLPKAPKKTEVEVEKSS